MGNVCQNQRDQDTYKNREKSPKKLQAHMEDKSQICNQQDPTQSEIREFMTDLNGDSALTQQVLYLSSEFEKATQHKISINDFRLEKVLGKGSFGKVMLVYHIYEEKNYAMKVLLKKSIKNERQKRHTMTERQILEKIDHPFIVKLHYAFQTKEKLYLVLDFMVGGELFHHLKKYGKFPEDIARFYAAQIILGLEHLHELKIIYRDLKPENILLDADGNLKLADFGLSKMGVDQNAPAHSLCGTPEYLAPEIITSKNGHDKTVDWWSFGALLYEMLTGSPPFYSNNKKQMLQNIIYKPIPIPKNLSEKSKSLLQQLLVVNPAFRLGYGNEGTQNVKNHPFFASVDWELMKLKTQKTPLNISVADTRDTKYFDPYILKQQPMDTPASYNQDFFKFSQFTYNKKIEEVQMEEYANNQERNNSNDLLDLNGIGGGNYQKDDKTPLKIDELSEPLNGQIVNSLEQKKINEIQQVIQDQDLTPQAKTNATKEQSLEFEVNISQEKSIESEQIQLLPEEKSLVQEVKTLQSKEKPFGSEDKQFGSEEKPFGSEEKTCGSEEKPIESGKLGSEEKYLVQEVKRHETEEKIFGSEEKPLALEEKMIESEEKLLGQEEKLLGQEEKSLGSDEINIGQEKKMNGLEENLLELEDKTIESEEKVLEQEEKQHGKDEINIGLEQKINGSDEKPFGIEEKINEPEEKPLGQEEKQILSQEKLIESDETGIEQDSTTQEVKQHENSGSKESIKE